jgi:hypothetical protein
MPQTRKRMVILTIDTMGELLKDYLGGDNVPTDAVAQRLLINPQENGKLALELASPNIKRDAKPIYVNFDIKRIYNVS